MVTDSYCLVPADLRDLGQLAAALEAAGLDTSAPTFVLSECVLVYLKPQHRWVCKQAVLHVRLAATMSHCSQLAAIPPQLLCGCSGSAWLASVAGLLSEGRQRRRKRQRPASSFSAACTPPGVSCPCTWQARERLCSQPSELLDSQSGQPGVA